MQHETVMGSLCSQSAIGAIHALRTRDATMSCGNVNIHILLKENPCTLYSPKMSIQTTDVKTFELFVNKNECLSFL